MRKAGLCAQDERETSFLVDDGIPVGRQIRDLRKAKGMTIPELALKVDRSVGWVSQIERSISSVPIPILKSISDALDVQITWFFQGSAVAPQEERDVVVRRDARRKLRYTGTGVTEELLSPNLSGTLELLMSTFMPGTSSGEPYTRNGEEAGYVVSGTLELNVDGEIFILQTGDSFQFESHKPHCCRNPGDEPTEILWIVTPPSY